MTAAVRHRSLGSVTLQCNLRNWLYFNPIIRYLSKKCFLRSKLEEKAWSRLSPFDPLIHFWMFCTGTAEVEWIELPTPLCHVRRRHTCRRVKTCPTHASFFSLLRYFICSFLVPLFSASSLLTKPSSQCRHDRNPTPIRSCRCGGNTSHGHVTETSDPRIEANPSIILLAMRHLYPSLSPVLLFPATSSLLIHRNVIAGPQVMRGQLTNSFSLSIR